MKTQIVAVPHGELACELRGGGRPIVFIHAGYLDSRMWDRQVEHFSREFLTLRYDIRGYGRSTAPSSEYSDAEDLKAVLDGLGIEQPAIVGVSNGGRIALDFAVEYPEAAAAFVLMDFGISGYKFADEEESKLWAIEEKLEPTYRAALAKGDYRAAAKLDVDLWTSRVSSELRERLIEIAAENVHDDEHEPTRFLRPPEPPAFERLDAIQQPTLMILGEHDLPGQFPMARRAHERISGSRLVTIPGADHIPSLSTPEAFDRELSLFLEEIGFS